MPTVPSSVSSSKVTIGRVPLGFSAAPASGSSAGRATICERMPDIFISRLPRCRRGKSYTPRRVREAPLTGKSDPFTKAARKQSGQGEVAWRSGSFDDDECARYISQALTRTCAGAAETAGQPRRRLRYLAELELGRGRS